MANGAGYVGLKRSNVGSVVHTHSSCLDAVAKLVLFEVRDLSCADHDHKDPNHDAPSNYHLDDIHRLRRGDHRHDQGILYLLHDGDDDDDDDNNSPHSCTLRHVHYDHHDYDHSLAVLLHDATNLRRWHNVHEFHN